MKPVIITICLMLLVPMVCAYGTDRLVPSQYPTIQAAVNAAASGDTVILAPGTYSGDGNCDITVNNSITIRSQNGPETCILDCNANTGQSHRGFTLNAGTLAGLTITGGYSDRGGAVYCNGSSSSIVKITNCILTGNISKRGGAVFCNYGNLEIMNCFLTNNSSGIASTGYGGAIYCESGSVLVANSTISGNSSGAGGGIYCAQQGIVTIKNCAISNNSALSSSGGGIYCDQGSMAIIVGSDISRNSASRGAGIYCVNATSSIISDCNIHGNVAQDPSGNQAMGGGIYNSVTTSSANRTPFSILQSSITDNVVKGIQCQGGGLYFRTDSTSYGPSVLLTGCIVARNSAQAPPNSDNSYGGGIYSNGRILLSETEVKENSAYRGGGIYNDYYSYITMNRCQIRGNSAAVEGSAMVCTASETILENCVVSGNLALQPPSLCAVIQGDDNTMLRIANCTIVGNTPPVISSPVNSLSSITNSIIYWNCPNQNEYYPLSYGIPVSHSDLGGCIGMNGTNTIKPGIGNINADPCFAVPGHWDTNGTPSPYDDFWVEGDYRLTAVSPCIDSGGYASLMDNKDLAGNLRVIGATIDMGAYESNNTPPPVAEAGPDQIVYAWIDSNAAVTLDGSKSYDADGDKLSYLWNWTIDGNSYETNGVSPTIKLPVGEHKIELIVNDNLEDSQPDDVNITVAGPVKGQLWVLPPVINRQAGLLNILTILKLPADITKEQIDSGYKLLLYPGGIEAKTKYITQSIGQIRVVASFDKSALLNAISTNGNSKLYVVGRLTTGQYFFGQSIIRIINPSPIPYLPKL
jgi:Right handed beta helix region/PKD domain